MEKQIIDLIKSLKSDQQITSFDEASTKQAIVIRILSLLGWDIFNVDEVKPDFHVGSQPVDYALRVNKANKVFINVKKVGHELNSHQKTLLGCAVKEGVELSILTNGITWWFYLSLSQDPPEQRRFYSLDLLEQNPGDIAPKFIDFLEKGKLSAGKSLKTAKLLKKNRQRKAIEKTISIAWRKLLSEPHELLVKLLSETIVKTCGYEAEKEMIAEYLAECARSGPFPDVSAVKAKSAPVVKSYDGRIINSFSFKNITYNVHSWEEFIGKLCDVLVTKYNHDTEKLLWHSLDSKFYFNESPDELRLPANIGGTNIFVETRLSPDDTVKLARSVLSVSGYSDNDLSISSQKKNSR